MNKTNFTTIEFESTSGDEKKIEFSFTTQCEGAGVISVYSKPSWLDSSISGKIVTLTTNSSTLSQRDGYVVVAVDGEPCDSESDKIPVIQKTSSCSCGNFDMDTSTISWDSNEGRDVVKSKSYSENCVTVYDVSVGGTDSGHFHASNNGHKIEVYPDGTNLSETSKNATVTVKYKTDTVPDCGSKTFNVIHNGTGCECGILRFKVDGESGSQAVWDYDAHGSNCAHTITYEIVNGKGGCITDGVSVSIVGDGFDYETVNDHTIKVWPINENPSEEQPVTATVKYSYTLPSGTVCDGSMDNVSLIQVKKEYCKCGLENICVRQSIPDYGGNAANCDDGENKGGGYYRYYLGSGNSNGCGRFYSNSKNPGYPNPKIWNIDVTKDTQNENKYNFYLWTLDRAAGSINNYDFEIHFERKYGTAILGTCSRTYHMHQERDYAIPCILSNSELMTIYPQTVNSSSHTDYAIGRVQSSVRGGKLYKALYSHNALVDSGITVDSSVDWIKNLRADVSEENYFYIRADVSSNSGPQRNATITVKFESEALKEYYGICNNNFRQTFTITQDASTTPEECDCKETQTTAQLESNSNSGETSYTSYYYAEDCFGSGSKFILADSGGTIIQGSDSSYQPIRYGTWLSGYTEAKLNTSGEKYGGLVHLKWAKNNNTQSRNVSFYLVINLDGKTCRKKINFNQEGIISDCATLNNSIKGYTAEKSYVGGEVSAAYTDQLLMSNTRLSAETISSGEHKTPIWITNIHTKENDFDDIYVNLEANTTTEGDRATKSRDGYVKTFFVYTTGADAGKKVKLNGVECEGKDVKINQAGYAGICQSCVDFTSADIKIKYDGYGQLKPDNTHWTCSSALIGQVPAYHSASTSIDLFECELQNIDEDIDFKCFSISAETNQTNWISSVSAVRDGDSKTKFKIKGKPNKLVDIAAQPVAITLHLMKWNNVTKTYSECSNKIQNVGHIVVLPYDSDGNELDCTPD